MMTKCIQWTGLSAVLLGLAMFSSTARAENPDDQPVRPKRGPHAKQGGPHHGAPQGKRQVVGDD